MKNLIFVFFLVFVAKADIIAQKLAVTATPPSVLFETVTASVNEVSLESAIKLYPNPAINELIINVQQGYEINSGELYIYDASGKSVIHDKNIVFKNNAFTVNVRGFETGLYSLILNTKDYKAAINKKFIISKH